MQIDLTEAAIAGITGHYARLIRPPYSATTDAVTPQDERELATLAGRRYFVVLANYDSNDSAAPRGCPDHCQRDPAGAGRRNHHAP